MTPLLDIDDVSVHFPLGRGRYVRAVDGVSFQLGAGEAVALVGESGCGKSTLARLVNRQLDPTSGTIKLGGRDIGAIPPTRFARDPRPTDRANGVSGRHRQSGPKAHLLSRHCGTRARIVEAGRTRD